MPPRTIKADSFSPPRSLNVEYLLNDEKEDSEYQVLWSKTMDQGNYKNSSTYQKVEALLLCWAEECDDLVTRAEVHRLKEVLEDKFNYNAHIEAIDNSIPQKLQVQINAKVAAFVAAHDGPNTLLIVYYAGHGKPGEHFGDLQFLGQTSPNDSKKRMDRLVWNRAEELLKIAESDVLQIFDCCYAGTLGLTRGEYRLFEYLAATDPMGTTAIPGDNSFTSALIYALKALVEKQRDGRFTTVDIMRKIMECPDFPPEQTPMLSDRVGHTSAGRIMLHPLNKQGSGVQTAPVEFPHLDLAKRQTLTLHFDLMERPEPAHVEELGLELNRIFARRTLGVNRVRWGGMQSMATRVVRTFIDNAERSRKKRGQSSIHEKYPDGLLSPRPQEPPTPSSTVEHSPRLPEYLVTGESILDTALPLDLGGDLENDIQGRRKRQRLNVEVGSRRVANSSQGSQSDYESGMRD